MALNPTLGWKSEIILEEFSHVVDFDIFWRGELWFLKVSWFCLKYIVGGLARYATNLELVSNHPD